MIENLILSGGSIKGISYLGLIKALYEKPDIYNNIKVFGGASIGSLFATCLALNISYEHLITFLNQDFTELLSFDIEYLIEEYGLDKGDQYIEMICEILGEYKDLTFKELYDKVNKRLIMSATCLNNYNVEYFDYISHPNMKIIDGIRASISIPFLFTAVKMNDKTYIDGAILEPLPISLFDRKNTLGIMIVDKNYRNGFISDLNTLQDFAYNFILCVKRRLDILNNFEEKYDILHISLANINFLDFNINIEKKNQIIKIGYDTVKTYLEKNT